MIGVVEDLARTLARVDDLDEDRVRAELELRFRDAREVEAGVTEWRRIRRRPNPIPPNRRDLD